MKEGEITICGLAAVRARFRRDSSSIVRLFFDKPMSKQIGLMCRALAGARKVYRCVEPSELAKIADSHHHGGIVAVVEEPPPRVTAASDAARNRLPGESSSMRWMIPTSVATMNRSFGESFANRIMPSVEVTTVAGPRRSPDDMR